MLGPWAFLLLCLADAWSEEGFLAWQNEAKQRPSIQRPRYLGSTDSAEVRKSTQLALQRGLDPSVKELCSVVGGMSGLDLLQTLEARKVKLEKLTFFDVNELQLSFGELILELVRLTDREGLVQALYGRSMKDFGRILCVSNMMEFLEMPVDQEVQGRMSSLITARLRGLYEQVFESLSRPSGWPIAWPCFGRKSMLPGRILSKSQRRLGGRKNEAFHINEAGWLESDGSFLQTKAAVEGLDVEFKLMNLKDLPESGDGRVVFISNIDGSPQFLASESLKQWRRRAKGTLLLSTRSAEWLD